MSKSDNMDENNTKIGISLNEKVNNENMTFNMDDLMEEVNKKYDEKSIINSEQMDEYIALETDYTINYVIPELQHIAKYYELSVRKKNKGELVQDIVIFEMDPNNIHIVSRRQYLWECLEQIKSDGYLCNFLNGI
jgi:hypothetical protein